MKIREDRICNCGHYKCNHIEEKKVKLTGRKTRMGCLYCNCDKFIDERSVAGMKPKW